MTLQTLSALPPSSLRLLPTETESQYGQLKGLRRPVRVLFFNSVSLNHQSVLFVHSVSAAIIVLFFLFFGAFQSINKSVYLLSGLLADSLLTQQQV